ncbi:MAG: hypothetical protein CUN56_08825 [Phototrophicales bacterium]|nr:MAG: hypothetical protein CUN56_08825 [Phototrophicales bacterium]
MGRVINTDNPGKRRNQLMRTCAEILRHLSQKPKFDHESRNMLAMLVLCLREIADGIEESTVAWEKRDYWIKAEEFRRRWNWTHEIASELEALIRTEQWDDIAPIMLKLIPYFKDIKVTRFTRNASIWQHAYDQLINEGN